MTRRIGLLLVALTAGVLLSSASAQDTKKGKLDAEAIFKKLDSNNDGKLTKDEFLKIADRFKDKEKAREKLAKVFEMIDKKNMGLSLEQFRVYLDNVKKKDDSK